MAEMSQTWTCKLREVKSFICCTLLFSQHLAGCLALGKKPSEHLPDEHVNGRHDLFFQGQARVKKLYWNFFKLYLFILKRVCVREKANRKGQKERILKQNPC